MQALQVPVRGLDSLAKAGFLLAQPGLSAHQQKLSRLFFFVRQLVAYRPVAIGLDKGPRKAPTESASVIRLRVDSQPRLMIRLLH